jgi:hypothetical protein
MQLRSGYLALALQLQEAADVSHQDIRNQLSNAVTDAHKGTGTWASYVDHTGDGESGDVIYHADGGLKKAPYEISQVGGKASTHIDTGNAVGVTPCTTYQEQADDDDQYSSMSEAFVRAKLYTELPLYERFISKTERSGASEEDFAGKGKSFPILKPQDVGAAVHAMGRAGSGNLGMAALKARIIAIAKRKGYTSELPKAWQGDSTTSTESKVPRGTNGEGSIKLTESAGGFLNDIPLTEAARSTYPIKLISPGTGSMAHYPAAILERDGPKVFTKGTLMFWNHPTKAEEAARPEGDLNNLAAILTTDARYDANGAKGPGLYAEAKVMGDYAEKIAERAPHIGLSIRAGGTGTGKMIGGQPELASIDYAESVDYVTKAGRGGLALAEAARDAGILPKEADMTAEEAKVLVQEAVATATAPLRERALRADAREEATSLLASVTLPDQAKARIIESVIREVPLKDGALDLTKFRESVVAVAKSEGEYLASVTGAGRVTGMGVAPALILPITETLKPEEISARAIKIFERLGHSPAAAAIAVKGRAA